MKIFFSSRIRNSELANKISSSLQAHGHTIWRGDRESSYFPPLMKFDSEAPDWLHVSWAIGEADCVMTLFTHDTMESSHVLNETHYGMYWSRERDLGFLPLVVGDVKLPQYMKNDFHIRIDPDFHEGNERELLGTLERIQEWLIKRREELYSKHR